MSGIVSDRVTRGISRDSLLSVAAELFAQRGYRATTLDDVAAALGVKKASLYHYIRSKEELLTDIYERIFDRIEAAVRPIAATHAPADERLRRMIDAHLRLVASERDMLAVAFQEEAELPPMLRNAIRSRKREYERIFEDVMEDGQRAGILRSMDTQIAVRGLLGMCNWIYQWFRPGRHSIEDIATTFASLLDAGWLASPPAGGSSASPARSQLAGSSIDREALLRIRRDADELLERLGHPADGA